MDGKIDQPFHAGELRAQELAGGGPAGTGIRARMPDQHRTFFAQLPFICVGVNDADGWPLAAILHGTPGFATAPTPDTLRIAALPDGADPAAGALREGAAIGVLGIEMPTRRRNRANGTVTSLGADGFEVGVTESFGNCPKHITPRTVVPAERNRSGQETLAFAVLPDRARALVRAADTFFIASTGARHGGSDVSHRGGPPGFVKVEGNTLLVPDYPGNRYFNTLGNLLLEPRCALVLVDFSNGDVLQLQGRAEVLWDRPTPEDPMSVRSWRFHIGRGWLRPGAFPFGA
jgi:predicted pyridoxine 5'-phosphate oxidase superfamily flavin-nucleotide-binding protein